MINTTAGGAALLNMGVFIVVRADLHGLVASALGTGVAAMVNFVAGDHLVSRASGAASVAGGGHNPWESTVLRAAAERTVRRTEDA